MASERHDRPFWRTSSYSGGSGECVEVALAPSSASLHGIRDSKHPDSTAFSIPTCEWNAFMAAVQDRGL